jgi:hypothetical protein
MLTFHTKDNSLEVTIKITEGSTVSDIAEAFRGFLVIAGYTYITHDYLKGIHEHLAGPKENGEDNE